MMKVVVFFATASLILVNTRLIIDNLLHSNDIEEEIVSEANPRLNKNQIKEASEIVKKLEMNELTTILPSDRVENESTNSGVEENIYLEIQNASGINGAASELARKLQEQGYFVKAISTAPSLSGETIVFYKAGRKEQAETISSFLNKEGWAADSLQEKTLEQPLDIMIILAK